MLDPSDHVLDYVDAYLHELLTAKDARTVQSHCAECKICQVAMEEARRRFEALRQVPAIEAPESLIRAAQSRIDRYRPRRLTPARLGWLAAAVFLVAFAGVHVYYFTLSPSPYDLRILGQSELVAQSPASLRVLLVDHASNEPLEGVPVEISLADRKTERTVQLVSFTTDKWGSGSPRFRLPDWQSGDYELQVSAYPARAEESIVRTVKLKRSWQLMLTSDKPVYQPGQVIHVRTLALAHPELKPVAGHKISYSIRDPKSNVIFRREDVTSRFGIAAADCPLADEITEGAYQIECQVGDTTSSTTVEVKRYVLPKFKLDVALDQPYYQPGQKVRGTVDARYFFGKPVENAAVEIVVEAANVETSAVCRLERRTDAAGSAAFEFAVPERLVGREQLSGDASISIRATVVDSAGQKGARTLARVVTAEPIHVEVIPEAGTLVKGLANVVYLFTSYPDGRPAETRIAISGIHRELVANRLGVARVELTPDADQVAWTVRATDAEGKVGRREVTLTCGTATGDFLVRTDAAVYNGGQTMHILALGGGSEPVFLDLIKDGQTMLTDVVSMGGGRGQYACDLPPELCGTIELSAYRYDAAGLPVRKTQVVYVRPSRAVKIETTPDRKQYRPGDRAKLTFRLTDEQNRPVPGALSLAAVDEAVFSVLGQPPGMEKTFFTLQQELLKPVYAIYRWSPDMLPNASPAERAGLERALFARAGRQPADRRAVLAEMIKKFGDGDMRLLELLDRPDLDALVERVDVPKGLKALLRNQTGTYTLDSTSYPAKELQLEQVRRRMGERIKVTWITFAIVGSVIFVWLTARSLVEWLVVLVVVLMFLSLLLPSVQMAREAARGTSAANDLRQLGMAFAVPGTTSSEEGATPLRVRDWFPETLLWRPELITDDQGRATLDLDLADSITTWRLSASAITAAGQLGADQASLRVFQPFFVDLNLPVALTRGDEVAVPVVVYNYLDKPQTVELNLAGGAWFKLLGEPAQKVELAAGQVRSVAYRIRAEKVGRFELEVSARAGGVADAVKRPIAVSPDGNRVEHVFNGTLQQPAEIECSVPPEAIEGSAKAIVKIYPSGFSQVVEGLDAIFQRPYGCFEQTSSTTYPNVLALEYLRQTKKSLPEVEAKARQYIHLGYQRLLRFEVAGGGFDWFGNPPANRTLTAYGLMEFEDMARVHEVDSKLIERTRQWLLAQRAADGSWASEGHALHDDPTRASQLARLGATAYVAWAVFSDSKAMNESWATREYLLAHRPEAIDDPYVLALVANALLGMNLGDTDAGPYLDRLESVKRSSPDGKLAWWDSPAGRTMFYGAGRSGSVETTSLAALAMLHAGRNPATARGALAWLVGQRDSGGTWYSTQATVLALKVLVVGAGKPLGDGKPRQVEIRCDDKLARDLVIPASQADVVQQIDLSSLVSTGSHRLTITDRSDTAAVYQVSLSYHVPEQKGPAGGEALSIELAYDKSELGVDDTVNVTASVVNKTGKAAPMVVLDLPIPPGFAIASEDLGKLAAAETIAKYQLTPRSAIVYLRELPPAKPLVLQYRLRAIMPVKITVPPARAYEYYDPDTQAASKTANLTVTAGE
ncbi:MAG: MG2 domain-containing protein [Pirellulales bacterium]